MAETSLQFRTPEAGGTEGNFFLCHNSKNKPAIKKIADGLELEFARLFSWTRMQYRPEKHTCLILSRH